MRPTYTLNDISKAAPEAGTLPPAIRDYGDGCHLVAHLPAGHPALVVLRPAAVWVSIYNDLRLKGAPVCAYDLAFEYDDNLAELAAWLGTVLADSHNDVVIRSAQNGQE